MLKILFLALRSTLFYLGYYLTVAAFATVGFFLRPLELHARIKFMRIAVKIILFWLRVTCGIKHQVHGLELLEQGTPSMILSRHESTWEALAFHAIFPLHRDVVKKELTRIIFFGSILKTIESIVLHRKQKTASIRTLKKQGKLTFAQNLWLVVFPGGTRLSHDDPSQIQPGAAIIAKQENPPIYLVHLNSGLFWPKSSYLKYPGTIHVWITKLDYDCTMSLEELNAKIQDGIDHPKDC